MSGRENPSRVSVGNQEKRHMFHGQEKLIPQNEKPVYSRGRRVTSQHR